jgi:uncharacterized membrane protein
MAGTVKDDTLTLIALGLIAFIAADVTHEALGHGLATLAVGAKPVLLTSSYFSSSETYSRWIPAAGGIANVVVGLPALWAARRSRRSLPRFLFVLLAAFNLLFAAAYPFYSGVAGFGDWAAVISGLEPAWLWRAMLVVVSVVLYWVFLQLLAVAIRPFCNGGDAPNLARLRRITLLPFVSAMAVAGVAGALNPRGLLNVFMAAIPAAAASCGMTQLDHFRRARMKAPDMPAAEPIAHSTDTIIAAAVIAASFVGLLGPGVRFS